MSAVLHEFLYNIFIINNLEKFTQVFTRSQQEEDDDTKFNLENYFLN